MADLPASPVQMAALLVPEPIFEAGFVDSSYGRRPGRSAHDALAEIRQHLQAGRREVYDADLQGNFDTNRPADHADPQKLVDSVLKAEENLQAIGCEQSIEEMAADKVTKRCLIATAAHNLGRSMWKLLGVGKPRRLRVRAAAAWAAYGAVWNAVCWLQRRHAGRAQQLDGFAHAGAPAG